MYNLNMKMVPSFEVNECYFMELADDDADAADDEPDGGGRGR